MNTTDDTSDIRFRKLFQKTAIESPSPRFTGEVMSKIARLETAAETDPVKNFPGNWPAIAGISALVLLGLAGMYYFGLGILPGSFEPILSPVFGSIFKSFKGLFDSLEISGTTIAIILGFALLVILERILSRLNITKRFYFSF